MNVSFVTTACGLLLMCAGAEAQVARQEIHPLQSVTLSDADFLNGKKDGTPVMLSGVLRLPKVGNENSPAVVLLHGSGGQGGTGAPIDEWSKRTQ